MPAGAPFVRSLAANQGPTLVTPGFVGAPPHLRPLFPLKLPNAVLC